MELRLREYRCPYCFGPFKTSEESDEVEMAPNCGHEFTLGEARRGRPDPVTDPLVVSDIGALWKRVAALEQQLAEVKATTDMLNAVVGRMLPA